MHKKFLALVLMCVLLTVLLGGCAGNPQPTAPTEAPAATAAAEPVTLTITGGWPDCRALDIVAQSFMERYPNCTIVYEYLQDYYASLEKRMRGEEPIDLFFTTNLQEGNTLLPYTLDLFACEGLDLTNTFDGLIENFTLRDPAGGADQLYALPLGAEIRGMFINKTLLDSLDIPIPTDQATLLAACQTLKEHGYIPFHGNPGKFSQALLYPWVCNLIANADDPAAVHAQVNARESGVSELFREPLTFLYDLVEEDYYDYKRAQSDMDLFTETSDEDYARYFLNIQKQDDAWFKADDLGRVAFMPATLALDSTIAKTKDDYHSAIEYVFALAPISADGGFAYLSPAHGIAVCKESQQQEWAIKFLDFLFEPENNQAFAQAFNIIPNTKEAFSYLHSLFDVPDNHISHLGQVTFDYGFYNVISSAMVDISKANNPKYMQDDGQGNVSLYPLDYYMTQLETSFQEK